MSALKLWNNPLRPVEENFELAVAEIERLNERINRLRAEQVRENDVTVFVPQGQRAFRVPIEVANELVELRAFKAAHLKQVPVRWINGCDQQAIAALRYLAENERPYGGESEFNAEHLFQIARELERMSNMQLYTMPTN